MRSGWTGRVGVVAGVVCLGSAVADVRPIAAQQRDSIPGVTLGLTYETGAQPALALQPFTSRFGGGAVAPQVEAIIGRDLRNSDRYTVMDSLPASLTGQGGVDYGLWDGLGAVWLVTGQVEGAGDDLVLVLELHNVVYSQVEERGRFFLPSPDSPDFRMAVHRVSDQIVEWSTGDPGMAASRIAFSMLDSDGNKDIWLIDSDGENLRRVTDNKDISLSPTWHPSGGRIAYMTYVDGYQRIVERNLATGEEKQLPAVRGGSYITPTYHPDGQTLAFSVSGGTRSGIFTYNIERDCCLAQLSSGPGYDDLSPTYSPDGQWVAFNTNRFGSAVPQVMVMPAQGGSPQTLSPYSFGRGGYFSAPDWAPVGSLVAFHGAIRRGTYHILVADMEDGGRRLRQLTWEGNNEDPSWAPDGRHLVFVGERRWGYGLLVVDVVTGRTRTLLGSRQVNVPAWSPALPAPR